MNHSSWRSARSQRLASADSGEYEKAYEEARLAFALGQMVYDRRTELGLTQTELAARAGMKQPAVSRIEGGGTVPTVPLLRRLAEALDADLRISFTPRQIAQEEPPPADDTEVGDVGEVTPEVAAAVEYDEALLATLLTAHLITAPAGPGDESVDKNVAALHSALEPLRELAQRRGRVHRGGRDELATWVIGVALLSPDEPGRREFFESSKLMRLLAHKPPSVRPHEFRGSLASVRRRIETLEAELEGELERLANA
ncbi:helix-turn-helix domain-containing protein [Streptomyces hirsutus]|uniref:helix-turn-helix domain-containing protein n=1 Tax=Streptomyces hirsutus TaxID=35620 RepID=UPI0036CF9C41